MATVAITSLILTASSIERRNLEKIKDEFIGIITHELKTPLTSVKAYSQIIYRELLKMENQKLTQPVSRMEIQINKLSKLINDLLDISKIKEGKLDFSKSYFNFNELVWEIIDEMQPTTVRHTIVANLAKTKTVYGDRERIGQVITNLLSNAIKYSPQRGEIIVTTKAENGNIELSVKDFGIGIIDVNRKRVFDKMFRVSQGINKGYPGLGLGLFIAKEIILGHGGAIWVRSKKDKGSTFYFSIPIEKDVPSPVY
jgi:signal transduction histidine kinase